jgi:hypothetical protein
MGLISRRNFAIVAALRMLQHILDCPSAQAHAAPASKAKSPKRTHIKNRRLFDLQDGTVQLEKWEKQHLHECRDCQDVLYVFMMQPNS